MNRKIAMLALALFLMCLWLSSALADIADGKLMLLEIHQDGKSMAVALWPEKVGARPDSLWPYLKRQFMAKKQVMPKPAKGTAVTLKGKIVIRLRWPSGETFDTIELDQLTLTYTTPDPAFPNETRWLIKPEEIERIHKFVNKKQAEEIQSSEEQ